MIFYLLFYGTLLFYAAQKLGIGPSEAKIIFQKSSWLHFLEYPLYKLYPNEFFVRLPVIIVSLINIYLFYKVALLFVKKEQDAKFAAVLFSLLPAVIASSVLVNKAPFIIFFTAIFILIYQKYNKLHYFYLLFLLLLDKAFAILFLALFFYALYKKQKDAFFYAGLFIFSLFFYGFDVGGKPKSYFLDTFAIFGAIFSPLLFLYFFYVIYRILVKEQKDIVWFISAVSFLFALIVSFRQKISLIDFAPFAVFGVILIVKTFLKSLRVRLPRYRKKLQFAFFIVMATLLFNDAVLLYSDLFFPSRSAFVKKYHIAKIFAQKLHLKGIHCLHVPSASFALQLRFYGIKKCSTYTLSFNEGIPIAIIYHNHLLEKYYVTKSNFKK